MTTERKNLAPEADLGTIASFAEGIAGPLEVVSEGVVFGEDTEDVALGATNHLIIIIPPKRKGMKSMIRDMVSIINHQVLESTTVVLYYKMFTCTACACIDAIISLKYCGYGVKY